MSVRVFDYKKVNNAHKLYITATFSKSMHCVLVTSMVSSLYVVKFDLTILKCHCTLDSRFASIDDFSSLLACQ